MNAFGRTLQALLDRGVAIRCPWSVDVDPSVRPERIAANTVIHAGCRLRGAATLIAPGCVLGEEGPVTLDNCQLGENVALKGGFFSGATFLDGAAVGSCAHVRPGTLLEEQACCGHAVGLKQTILLPFTVLGSLINFCDCLLAGGTDRRNHSEVGSAFVHFNYTPHRDKATPSLFGDVPRGVMLDQRPIFLGGQGGAVGPLRVEFGTVVAAGTVLRRDALQPDTLVFGQFSRPAGAPPYTPGLYGDIRRLLLNNFAYLGNLHALYAWYREVRAQFVGRSDWREALLEGALARLQEQVRERLARLAELAERLRDSCAAAQRRGAAAAQPPYARQKAFADRWPELAPRLELRAAAPGAAADRDRLLAELARRRSDDYLQAIRDLSPAARQAGTAWLQSIVEPIQRLAEE